MTEPIPVVLCGGYGTRLWPLSRRSLPKQFVPLFGDKTLLQLTLERLALISRDLICVTAEEHRFLVADTLALAGANGTVILESAPHNTAVSMGLAALQAQAQAAEDALLLFCPADHHIPDAQAFSATVARGRRAAEAGMIVTFGIAPTQASTAYGYIRRGEQRADGSWSVRQFVEKPDATIAGELLALGDALWNSGVVLSRADVLLTALDQHASDIFNSCCEAMAAAASDDLAMPTGTAFLRPALNGDAGAASIDCAVMEKHQALAVVPLESPWSDIGSWTALAELARADAQGNRGVGHGLALHSSNTYIHAPHRPVVALGVEDLLIIDTPDALLVTHRQQAEQVSDVVEQLDCQQATQHRKVHRPWGWYDSIDLGPRFQVKRLMIKAGASLSLQMHHHRAEHWVVVQGTAEVTRGNETFLLTENQSTYIPLGEKHRLANRGKLPLEIIEVQSGSYLGEDDIVRFDDAYGRLQT